MSERKQGWHWVRFEDEWEPCEYHADKEKWCVHYAELGWLMVEDSAFDEIGPRIPLPNEASSIGTRYRDEVGEVVAVVVPAAITAETGHKAALMSEFSVTATDCCYSCEGVGTDDNDDDCLTCEGSGEVEREIGVPWTTIKAIHRAMIDAIPEP